MKEARKPSRSRQWQKPTHSLLTELVVEHGPIDLIGRFFLAAVEAADLQGVHLGFAPMAQLIEENEKNRDSWPHIVTLYDEHYCNFQPRDAFCILGWSATGEVVTANAGRFYDWPETNIAEELRSLRLFYDEPERMMQPAENFELTGNATAVVAGRVAYVGAAWVAPAFRGRQLSAILPRLAKAYALTRWNPDVVTSLMNMSNLQRGLATKFGYPHVDDGGRWTNSLQGDLGCSILWMTRDELTQDLTAFLSHGPAQVDAGVLDRQAQQSRGIA